MSFIYDTGKINDFNHLTQLGWSSYFQTQLDQLGGEKGEPARIVGMRKNSFRLCDGKNESLATLAGRLKYDAEGAYPVTGDWVLAGQSVITKVLRRKNCLARGASGTHNKQETTPQKEQVIAANLDTVFIVVGLDRDFNPRRIERYLTLVYNCGLTPVIVLTKADLHQDPERFALELEPVALGVPIHLLSFLDDDGLIVLEKYLALGATTTLIGSSGAGKSTMLNRLCGENIQETGPISDHVGKGKHTTTSRDLIVMPQGGMIIDNPGIREIAFWDVDNGIETAFPEIESWGRECRFVDCTHTHEPGCRVLEAVDEGEIPRERLENYRKMSREMEYIAQRQHKSANRVEKERWKGIALKRKDLKKRRP